VDDDSCPLHPDLVAVRAWRERARGLTSRARTAPPARAPRRARVHAPC